jgi:hypothetical protein
MSDVVAKKPVTTVYQSSVSVDDSDGSSPSYVRRLTLYDTVAGRARWDRWALDGATRVPESQTPINRALSTLADNTAAALGMPWEQWSTNGHLSMLNEELTRVQTSDLTNAALRFAGDLPSSALNPRLSKAFRAILPEISGQAVGKPVSALGPIAARMARDFARDTWHHEQAGFIALALISATQVAALSAATGTRGFGLPRTVKIPVLGKRLVLRGGLAFGPGFSNTVATGGASGGIKLGQGTTLNLSGLLQYSNIENRLTGIESGADIKTRHTLSELYYRQDSILGQRDFGANFAFKTSKASWLALSGSTTFLGDGLAYARAELGAHYTPLDARISGFFEYEPKAHKVNAEVHARARLNYGIEAFVTGGFVRTPDDGRGFEVGFGLGARM